MVLIVIGARFYLVNNLTTSPHIHFYWDGRLKSPAQAVPQVTCDILQPALPRNNNADNLWQKQL
jgi:hypothetical protein